MTSRQCTFVSRFFTVALGVLCILCGVYLLCNWIEMFTRMRGKKMALSPTSPAFDSWKISPLPLNFDVYLFNWTNPEDFKAQSKNKPKFQQLGPYRFREMPDKVDIEWNTNNTVSFRKNATFFFDAQGSNGTLEDIITTVDTVAHSAALRIKDENSLIKFFHSKTLSSRGVSISKTADEWIFSGYKDPLVSIGGLISTFTDAVKVPYDRIGWQYTRNNSAYYDGHFNMYTGADSISRMGQIYAWNNKTHNGIFEGECGAVKGSMGEFFPPNLKPQDSVFLYVPNICRAVPLDYTETVKIHGVTAYKYSGTKRSIDNGTLYPENKCFCVNGKCEASGLFSIAPCKYNSSIYMSYPHFYQADPMYLEAVDGLSPDKDKHEFFMTLEPNAGVPMDVGGGFQANYLLEPIKGVDNYGNIPRTFIPIMWAEERVRVTAEIASDIALVPLIVLLGQILTGALLAAGVILICWYPTKSITQLCKDPKSKNSLLRPLAKTAAAPVSASAVSRKPKDTVSLLEHSLNGGVNLLRVNDTSSITESLLNSSNHSSNRSSSDVISR